MKTKHLTDTDKMAFGKKNQKSGHLEVLCTKVDGSILLRNNDPSANIYLIYLYNESTKILTANNLDFFNKNLKDFAKDFGIITAYFINDSLFATGLIKSTATLKLGDYEVDILESYVFNLYGTIYHHHSNQQFFFPPR